MGIFRSIHNKLLPEDFTPAITDWVCFGCVRDFDYPVAVIGSHTSKVGVITLGDDRILRLGTNEAYFWSDPILTDKDLRESSEHQFDKVFSAVEDILKDFCKDVNSDLRAFHLGRLYDMRFNTAADTIPLYNFIIDCCGYCQAQLMRYTGNNNGRRGNNTRRFNPRVR